MHQRALFRQSLGLTALWEIRRVSFDAHRGRLELRLNFPRDSTFSCPNCGREERSAYDTTTKWLPYVNFSDHPTIIEARMSRVE